MKSVRGTVEQVVSSGTTVTSVRCFGNDGQFYARLQLESVPVLSLVPEAPPCVLHVPKGAPDNSTV